MSTTVYLRQRSNELEQNITFLQTTKQKLADSYGLCHADPSPAVSMLDQELEIKQKELAEVRAVLKK